ncbi:MAG TPA: L-threonylcarbamoyladenylate synthase [Pyrinomonadaceae bacterium]|nr:L-threonylcarbamoyladenylate synthase [Pyrinomonadaceae bacterium]
MTAAEVIANGGVVAFRTDTFYGLGVDPFNAAAVARLKAVKGREDNKPILLLISDAEQAKRLIDTRSVQFKIAAREFWPGPLTVVGSAIANLPEGITAGTGTVGIRLPDDEGVREFVRTCGRVLTATSANPAGREPARSAREVASYFTKDLDLIVDGGEVTATEPSTVLDVLSSPPRIVREGAIPRSVIEQFFA